jgi:hypothetical protein
MIFFHIICILILVLILIGIWYILNIRHNNNAKEVTSYIIYPSRDYINNIIDDSNYFSRMNNINLLARNINSSPGYIKLYKNSIKDFSIDEKNTLLNACKIVDKYTDKNNNFKKIQWKFVKQSNDIENGWPHTLGDVIILTTYFFKLNNKTQVRTLLHEKIHIYQRYYPILTNKLFIEWNFTPIDKIENIKLSRNNPDINDFVYEKEGKIIVQLYNSNNPNDIGDSSPYLYSDNPTKITAKELDIPSVAGQYEHPNEIMATLLPEIIIGNFDDKTDFVDKTRKWIDTYF